MIHKSLHTHVSIYIHLINICYSGSILKNVIITNVLSIIWSLCEEARILKYKDIEIQHAYTNIEPHNKLIYTTLYRAILSVINWRYLFTIYRWYTTILSLTTLNFSTKLSKKQMWNPYHALKRTWISNLYRYFKRSKLFLEKKYHL